MRFGPTPGGVVNGKLLLTPYFNWGWNYVVTKDSKQPELSYLFALFASSPAMSTISVRQKNGYFDPFRQEHYNDTEIQNVYSKEFLKVHEQSLQSAIPDLYLANQSQYFTALSDGLAQALSGKLSADKALRKVAQQWNITTSRSDKILQKQRWMNLRQKYPANVAQLLRDISR
jgi:multiple sugar transport system substrate-binding protein